MGEKGDPETAADVDAATMARESDTHDVALPDGPLDALDFDHRYTRDRILGEGGMGTVWLYGDRQIGRRVAMKVMRRDQAQGAIARSRFLREAMLQGQLEHPSVAPVYDLGVAPDGDCYFTMKRVRGVTLADVIDGLRAGAPEMAAWSRRRLLGAFVSACQAVEFAHERGVLHRDLKPGNVMLGSLGEVYVLDWGLARARGLLEPDASAPIDLEPSDMTQPGAILGTPGYMSPEQVRGGELTAAADVYSLGAILFELLTYTRLHESRSLDRLLASTLSGAEARPSVRAPEREVPIELEQIVVRATALDADKRIATARDLISAIERFLDGERDMERRRELAAVHAQAAAELTQRARGDVDARHGHRRAAMREIGRALALDPDNRAAMDAMVQLLSVAPARLPAEVEAEVERAEEGHLREAARLGGLTYFSLFLYLPLFVYCGVRDWRWVGMFYLLGAATGAASFVTYYSKKPKDGNVIAVIFLSNLSLACTAPMFGALLFTPALMAVNAMAFALTLRRRHRRLALATACATLCVMLILQLEGWAPGGYRFTPEGMTIIPGAIALDSGPTMLLIFVTSIALMVTGVFPISRVHDAMEELEGRLYLYTWHLREMVPEAVRRPTDPTVARVARRETAPAPPGT